MPAFVTGGFGHLLHVDLSTSCLGTSHMLSLAFLYVDVLSTQIMWLLKAITSVCPPCVFQHRASSQHFVTFNWLMRPGSGWNSQGPIQNISAEGSELETVPGEQSVLCEVPNSCLTFPFGSYGSGLFTWSWVLVRHAETAAQISITWTSNCSPLYVLKAISESI